MSSDRPASDPASAVAQQTETPVNNTTVQQENPEEVDEQGDSDAVRSYLAQKLAERLGESSMQISQGQYEQGQAVLGDEYDDLLEKYVDVEGGTGENPAAESFEEASENQREFGSAVAEYNETYREYREAKQEGNTSRARELARELDRIEDRVNDSGQNLTRSYTEVENTTGADLSDARTNVQNTSREIQEQQEEVVSSTFVQVTLSAATNASTVSFADPATVRGRLVLENGTALRNETVEIRVGEHTYRVQTDGDGRFAVDYRPVRLSEDVEAVEVAYRPADRSVYLGANASVAVNVTQVAAALTVSTNATAVQFGDGVVVSGRAQVNGTPVSGARVRVTLGGYTLGTAVTAEDGSYRIRTTVPESVPTGQATVRSVIVPEDAAVGSEAATDSVQVDSTPVSLSINATRTDSQLHLSGLLQTEDGRPLAGQTVTLRVGGTTVATVETRRDGSFERTVSVSESLSGVVTVRAVYDEPATNLEDATAQARIDLDPGTAAEERLPVSPELLGGVGVVLLSLLVIAWLVRRSDETEVPEPASGPVESSSATESESGTDVVDQASSFLSAGDSEAAIRALYAAVRDSIGTADDSTRTHWEFYTAASDRLEPEAVGALERLTEAYERVVYSPEAVDSTEAEQVFEESEQLVGDQEEEVPNAD